MGNANYNVCVDFLKGISCIGVVFLHCEFPGRFGIIVQAISRFCVPFFFLVSGFFCYYPEDYDYPIMRQKKAHVARIICWSSLFYVLLAFVLKTSYEITRRELWAFGIFNQPFIIEGHLWFLFALLYDYFVFGFVWKADKINLFYRISVILLVVYACLAQGAHLFGVKIPNMYYRNWLIEGLPFFFAGHWIHANQDKICVSDRVLIHIILVSSLLCLVERKLVGRDFGVNILTIPQVFALFIYAVKHPDRHRGVIQEIGRRYSMWVYILHPFVYLSMDKLYHLWAIDTIPLVQWARPLVAVILTLMLSCIFYAILHRGEMEPAS